jgi:choline dehydrogenase-like flavoprotein
MAPRRPEVDRLYAAMASPRVRDGARREQDESMRAQVCVVGSGAGGATVACELARLGHSVILVEEGAYHGGRELGGEAEVTRDLLLRATPVVAGPLAIPIPTASCVGGTTVIGAGTSHRVPPSVLAAWEHEHGLVGLGERDLAPYYDRLEAELGVAPVADGGFGRNATLLERGARELGLAGGRVRRAAPGCLATGVCELGCPQDAKLGMHVSSVPLALEAGAVLYTRSRADRLLLSNGRVFGLQASFLDARGVPTGRELRVVADRVVVACGALATPALLERSGVTCPSGQLGRNLHIQPAARVLGSFTEEVRAFAEVPQAYEVEQFRGEGIALEGHFARPVELAHSLRAVGRAHKAIMARYAHLGAVLARLGDDAGGTVRSRRGGSIEVEYRIGDSDLRRMLRAIGLAAELLFAAGAVEVHPPLRRRPVLRSVAEALALRDADVAAAELDLVAHHPMGTARMAADAQRGVSDALGAVHGVQDLYVADASLLPSAITVAPQTTISALALRTAQHISEALGAPL